MTNVDPAVLVEIAELSLRVGRAVEPHGPDGVAGVTPLTGTEAAVMRWIHRNPGTSAAAGAVGTDLQRSNFSAALRSLEEKGMVSRTPDPDDARSIRLSATPTAEIGIKRLHDFWVGRLGTALRDSGAEISAADLQTVERVLTELDAGLRARR